MCLGLLNYKHFSLFSVLFLTFYVFGSSELYINISVYLWFFLTFCMFGSSELYKVNISVCLVFFFNLLCV